nr:NADH dehydrogenase subunit 3 [Linognathus vituli]
MILTIVISLILLSLLLPLVSVLFQDSESVPTPSLEPFECGIEPMEETRLPTSIQFLLIGILFLIFDIEVILVIPVISVGAGLLTWTLYWFTFTLMMLAGLLIELELGSLDWELY